MTDDIKVYHAVRDADSIDMDVVVGETPQLLVHVYDNGIWEKLLGEAQVDNEISHIVEANLGELYETE